MNKVFLILRITLISITAILIGYIAVFWIASLIEIKGGNVSENEDTIEVFLSTNGVHTDFIVPIENEFIDWQRLLGLSKNEGEWVAIGWGDRGFYLNTPEWKDLKLRTAFEAVSGLGSTALHVTQLNTVVEGKNCVRVKISKENYQILVEYIQKYFVIDVRKKAILIETTSYGLNDYFYEAKGSYSAFYTCNTWVNEGLKVASQKAALWTLTDTGVLRHYR